MNWNELMMTAARALAVYGLMLIVMRALGKRTVGNFAAFDLIVALMLGEVVDEIIYGEVSFLKGSTAIVVVAAAQMGNEWLSWWGHGFDRLLEGVPTVIVRDGRMAPQGMRKERMSERDLMGHLREQGVLDIRDVHLATVEENGAISVLRRPWAEAATRADVGEQAAKERRADLGGKDDPSPNERTDAPQYL